jgi:hypothetical protein
MRAFSCGGDLEPQQQAYQWGVLFAGLLEMLLETVSGVPVVYKYLRLTCM